MDVRWGRLVLVIGGVLLAASGLARADGIPPPPVCPAGTTLRMCHGPSYCALDTCTSDAACSGDDVCTPVTYCATSLYCGGGRPRPDAGPTGFATTSYGRTCAEGCVAGETCEEARVCAPRGTGGTRSTTYCGCSAVGAGHGGGLFAVLALLMAVGIGSRRP